MPALIPTRFTGRIVWLGTVPDRDAALASTPRETLAVSFGGPEEESHGGLTRSSCSRVTSQYPRGTEIRNTRQLSVLSQEELDAIAAEMGLRALDPALVGATMVIAGIPDFSRVPPSARLQGEGGATIVVDMENRPCTLPARPIENAHPGFGKAFKPSAAGRRGITAWVEREGTFRLGEAIRLHVPDQPVWAHYDEARDV
ncbi:MOSC domain-containing protein [Tabrizicola sp. J26]|uniref:MOSC domain-containing protein n=1 Tax=Alitabrizicola rongguiensis TaxID=2909234 RepID=UPI001F3EAE91|nr:MOSC domain-containing protein [Tabrizicola rongguiensis]MCF1707299.1 MOSC domain-containing protein [Tabrizicola rongguiensis]